jgi:probable rRNA maturation factor
MPIRIAITNRQTALAIDKARWRQLLTELLESEGIRAGEVSVAVVDDDEMQRLNRQFLQHDYPTDVLSFVLDWNGKRLDGEIIVSADTALARCAEFGHTALQELTLYVVHGALHLAGYDDKQPEDERVMRERESHYLQRFG